MNHENDTKSQKKEGRNWQNIYFILSESTRDQPKNRAKSISYADNPSEIEWTDDESYEYSEPYISPTDPAREVIQFLY